MAYTTNYAWLLPTVSGDSGAWGTILNNAISAIDAGIKTVADLAAAALPKAGGTMTGNLKTLTSSATRVDKGSISGAQPFDLSLAQCFTLTVGGALTVSFTNWPAGTVSAGCMFAITNGGAFVVTWPAAVKWNAGTAPTLTAAGLDRIVFISDDGGATIHGVVVGQAIA